MDTASDGRWTLKVMQFRRFRTGGDQAIFLNVCEEKRNEAVWSYFWDMLDRDGMV